MTLMEKLAEAQENLALVKTAVESGEKSADDLSDAINAVKEAQAKVDVAEEAEQMMKGLESPKEEKADKEEKSMSYRTIGENIAQRVAEKNIDANEKFAPFSLSVKTAAPMTTPSAIAPAITTVDTNLVLQPRRELTIRDLFSSETIAGSSLTYFVESSTVEGGAAYTTEGYEKPMVSFGDPTAITVALKKIASYLKESDEMIHDAGWLASAIDNRALYLHDLAVENYLVTALSGTSGIGTSSTLTPDGIKRAISLVKKNSGFTADAIVINPDDYDNIILRKDQNGQYYGGGFIAGAYGNGAIPSEPDLWGLRTIKTAAVAQGTAFVGAFGIGGSVIGNNEGKRFEFANQNEDDFIKNMITVRIEERIVLAVRRPSCFVKISGSSTSTEA